jgi:signal transduction histidine kinase
LRGFDGPVEVRVSADANPERRVELTDEQRRRLRHDLRTPLAIVTGFAEILAADRQISDADRREYAAHIQAAAEQIAALLDAALE